MPSQKIKQTQVQQLVIEFKKTKNIKLLPSILKCFEKQKDLLWFYFCNFDKLDTKKYGKGYRIYMSFCKRTKHLKAPLHFNLNNIERFCDKEDFFQFIDFCILRCVRRYIMHTQFENYVSSVLEYRTANFLVKCLRECSPDIFHKGLYYEDEYTEKQTLKLNGVEDYLNFLKTLPDFKLPRKINKYLPISTRTMEMFKINLKSKKLSFDYLEYAQLALHKVL